MGFIDFYKTHSKHCKFFLIDNLPTDVQNDLRDLLNKNDKRIGFFITHNFELNDNREPINTELNIAYYVRTRFPDIIYNDWHIPCGIRFWRMFRIAGGCQSAPTELNKILI